MTVGDFVFGARSKQRPRIKFHLIHCPVAILLLLCDSQGSLQRRRGRQRRHQKEKQHRINGRNPPCSSPRFLLHLDPQPAMERLPRARPAALLTWLSLLQTTRRPLVVLVLPLGFPRAGTLCHGFGPSLLPLPVASPPVSSKALRASLVPWCSLPSLSGRCCTVGDGLG